MANSCGETDVVASAVSRRHGAAGAWRPGPRSCSGCCAHTGVWPSFCRQFLDGGIRQAGLSDAKGREGVVDLRARGCDPWVQQRREGAGRSPCCATGGRAPGGGGSLARRGRLQHARPAMLALRNGD